MTREGRGHRSPPEHISRENNLYRHKSQLQNSDSATVGCNWQQLRCWHKIILDVLYKYACGDFAPPPCFRPISLDLASNMILQLAHKLRLGTVPPPYTLIVFTLPHLTFFLCCHGTTFYKNAQVQLIMWHQIQTNKYIYKFPPRRLLFH